VCVNPNFMRHIEIHVSIGISEVASLEIKRRAGERGKIRALGTDIVLQYNVLPSSCNGVLMNAKGKQNGGRGRGPGKGSSPKSTPKATGKKAKRASPGNAQRSVGSRISRLWPALRKADGRWAMIIIGQRSNGRSECLDSSQSWPDRPRRRGGGASAKKLEQLAKSLAALGHPQRLSMLAQLLDGPADHATLAKRTGMAAGPLYHHLNQLRLAGLMHRTRRDCYLLTRGGRNLVLGVLALEPLSRDARPMPVADET